jgi:hypothetical protein
MLSPESRLRPNQEEVAAKVMDGEAILINLANGSYYSMDKVGGVIWEAIERQCSLAEIAAFIAARYDAPEERIRADLEHLAAELLKEKLVDLSTESAGGPVPTDESQERLTYETPELNTYSDMKNLLALDPPPPRIDFDRGPESPDESGN